MKWDFLKADTLPPPPLGARAVAVMAGVGVLTGLVSAIPTPFPEMRLDDAGLLLNSRGVPLHAGIAFGAGIAVMMWLWVTRDLAECLLAMVLTVIGWLAAVNTASDLFTAVVGSELFGTIEGAKANRELMGLVLAGVGGGAIGAGLTAFGSGISAEAIRRPKNWVLIVAVGAALGVLLYPATEYNALIILFVPWQAFVAATIAFCLIRT
jgi:hypothetical protein